MGHPLIDEFCRAGTLHPDFIRRCQRVFRDEVQPLMDAGQQAIAENAELKAQIAALDAELAQANTRAKRRVPTEIGA